MTKENKYNELKDLLKTHDVQVTFTKKDGTERKMLCTLRSEVINELLTYNESKETKEINYDVMPVYDLEAKGWRSFIIENVTDTEVK